ncbi:MBL fold metallo-hydrolase [Saccharomonospora viridis]|uniref:MBL fold metallo-hydrolase n=1 Tax=Saccharomonospora viridis TaxID=1852 RepID=UPI0023F35606|nr:MBL fold metallo-hydrolase [Saccharomonospora viridis]
MLVVGFPAGALQANCYLLATGVGSKCVIVDPGQGAEPGIEKALREHRLTPVAVLATHGHVDHVASAAAVADAHDIAVHIHPDDRHLLSDPLAGLGPDLASTFGAVTSIEPSAVVPLTERVLDLAGLRITVDHTPGHTPGSVVFRVRSAEGGHLALTGDTLFAGSIGRTDLPGGDPEALATSLRTVLLPLAADTVVLPGHGGATTIGRERRSNPFLPVDSKNTEVTE